MIGLDESLAAGHLPPGAVEHTLAAHSAVLATVRDGTYGQASGRGWLEATVPPALVDQILTLAARIRQEAEVFVLVGVGGSNRAAQAVIEGLGRHRTGGIELVYAGDTLSARAVTELTARLRGKRIYANIIAKDFATLEPGLAFRALRSLDNVTYILTGSDGPGQLGPLAADHGYAFLPFPATVGGRFSAFSAVGLLPMAVMGVDIAHFLDGAAAGRHHLGNQPLEQNSALRYAVVRSLLQAQGFLVENLACFEPSLEQFARWWLQLHGETEGKVPRAILPMTTAFSEDLHAIGQYIQQGPRVIFETFLDMMTPTTAPVPESQIDDGFSYLDGQPLDHLNRAVLTATAQAHADAGIPVLRLTTDAPSPAAFGELMYQQMVSAYAAAALLGVEPFDQPGVESYKRNLQKELRR